MEIASVQWGLFFTFRLFSLIRPGLRPVHLPRRGRLPPAGEHSSGPGLNFQGSPPRPPPAGGTLSKPERAGIPSGGGFPYLPLGEGAAAAADEGRYQVGSTCRPTPVPASPVHPLPGEGMKSPRREVAFPHGEGGTP